MTERMEDVWELSIRTCPVSFSSGGPEHITNHIHNQLKECGVKVGQEVLGIIRIMLSPYVESFLKRSIDCLEHEKE